MRESGAWWAGLGCVFDGGRGLIGRPERGTLPPSPIKSAQPPINQNLNSPACPNQSTQLDTFHNPPHPPPA